MYEQEIFSWALTGFFENKEDPLIRIKKLCSYDHNDEPIKVNKKLKINWSSLTQSFFNWEDKKFIPEEDVKRWFSQNRSLKWDGHKISSDPLKDLWTKLKENDCYERLEIFITVNLNLLKTLPRQYDEEAKVCLYIDRISLEDGCDNYYLKKLKILEILQEIIAKNIPVFFLSKEDMIEALPIYEHEYLFWQLIHC